MFEKMNLKKKIPMSVLLRDLLGLFEQTESQLNFESEIEYLRNLKKFLNLRSLRS